MMTERMDGTMYQGAVYAMITAAMLAANRIIGLAASLREPLSI
jgi:ABC-type phosphate transport system permease subunit